MKVPEAVLERFNDAMAANSRDPREEPTVPALEAALEQLKTELEGDAAITAATAVHASNPTGDKASRRESSETIQAALTSVLRRAITGEEGMSDRERCLYCLRGKATDADWELNATLSGESEEAEAERLGLNRLCWEEQDHSCTAQALEIGRPTHLGEALEALDASLIHVLLSEIADRRVKREDVALTYALALRQSDQVVDWPKVNHAIVDRWSMSALKWIKTYAWKKVREP